ncbi:hypothetical protein HRG_000752 [Hirsutella rhossiliensis]|uniref:NACHT-NTPase and P-loop NTPases N-terminal domain-containing protein n=1 Tax=Hirsutella rhossiliensis TaxID=111463 RepID=A0A9P8N786_9HYPO|nr:uncharacterized protein HRG_00752 [Hirsutella rhossiliensis]KAH0968110.1 hypothetical protein HRG_00752 [Hirsutella rhossiliensis]
MKERNTKAKMSENIFKAVPQAPQPQTSRFEGYKAAARQEGQGRTVEVLVVGMMEDVCALAEIPENGAITPGMEDQVKGLHDAIDKLVVKYGTVLAKGEVGQHFHPLWLW